MTIQPNPPPLTVATRIEPPAPGLRALQSGATTLCGRAGFGNVCGNGVASAAWPPPITSVPFEPTPMRVYGSPRSEEHTSELQSHDNLLCRLLLEKKTKKGLVHRSHIVCGTRVECSN